MDNFRMLNTAKMTELMLAETDKSDRAFTESEVLFLLNPGQYLNFVHQKRFGQSAPLNSPARFYKRSNRKYFKSGGSDNGKEIEI